MLNDQYEPSSDNEEAIITALREGGRLRAVNISDRTGKTMQANNHYIRRLVAAGWISEPEDGLYELAHDPREMTVEERIALFEDHIDRLENGGQSE